jgi:hypothetical protein
MQQTMRAKLQPREQKIAVVMRSCLDHLMTVTLSTKIPLWGACPLTAMADIQNAIYCVSILLQNGATATTRCIQPASENPPNRGFELVS